MVEEMIWKIKNYPTKENFIFLSFLVHMFLHQNPNFFTRYFPLTIFDEQGKRKSVSKWTPFLSTSYDYYLFLNYFIAPVLHNLIRKGNIIWLDKEQTGYMQIFTPACDWFLGKNFMILHMWGFTSKPFLLPMCVTDRVLTGNVSKGVYHWFYLL